MPVAAVIAVAATAASTAASIHGQAQASKRAKAAASAAGTSTGSTGLTDAEQRYQDMQFALDTERLQIEQDRVKAENAAVESGATNKTVWTFGGITLLSIIVLLVAWRAVKRYKLF